MSIADSKKDLILNCIALGMDFFTSCLSVSLSKEEIEQLEADEEFQHSISIKQALLEKDLLQDHDTVIEKCVDHGVAAPLQWKLERLNPGRWGGRTKLETDKPLVGAINVKFEDATPEDKKD